MRKIFIFITLISLMIIGCSVNNMVSSSEVIKPAIEDSLQTRLTQQDVMIDSLYNRIDQLNYTVDSLYLALETANSRIAVNPDFQIPDSIVFAGRTFDLTNDRIRHKFTEIYEAELKSAHKFIPRSGKYFTK